MMSIWVGMILVAVISILVTALFFTIKGNIQLQKELDVSNINSNVIEKNLLILKEENKELERRIAYETGLQKGRRTDTLYRQILKQYTNGERFTLMMNGTKEDSNE